MAQTKPGKILIISSPSGGGKTSICRKLLSPARKKQGWGFSISYTTRSPRRGERDGREYHFVSDKDFRKKVQGDFFAEHFKVHLYQYGTPRKPIDAVRRTGGVMLLDVDVQGARRLKKEFPDAISVFVLPPSQAELRRRLRRRGTETKEQLNVRQRNAIKEMQTFRSHKFDYVVVNRDLDTAVKQVLAIVEAHQCRLDRIDPQLVKKIIG